MSKRARKRERSSDRPNDGRTNEGGRKYDGRERERAREGGRKEFLRNDAPQRSERGTKERESPILPSTTTRWRIALANTLQFFKWKSEKEVHPEREREDLTQNILEATVLLRNLIVGVCVIDR